MGYLNPKERDREISSCSEVPSSVKERNYSGGFWNHDVQPNWTEDTGKGLVSDVGDSYFIGSKERRTVLSLVSH